MFVSFEGVEGAGKTTQIARLAARLRGSGRQDILTTREPGDGPLGAELRRLALHPPMGMVRRASCRAADYAGRPRPACRPGHSAAS